MNYSELIEYNICFKVEYKDDETLINKLKVHEVERSYKSKVISLIELLNTKISFINFLQMLMMNRKNMLLKTEKNINHFI